MGKYILAMANRKSKRSEIWESGTVGILVEHME